METTTVATTATNALSIADLEAYDPHPTGRGFERRFLCPECGHGKPRDTAHRSMAANMETGAYNCHRCKASGKLTDFWQDRPRVAPRHAKQERLRRAFYGAPVVPVPQDKESSNEWRRHLEGLTALDNTPGASYLAGRGIPTDVATLAGVCYSPRWYGRRAVVFLIHNETGDLVAAQGRALDSADKLTAGPKSQGIFIAHSLAGERFFSALDRRLPAIILTEAPLDALSLAVCGFPAIALCGASGPTWLEIECGLRRILLATDADNPGDMAARELAARLTPYGARCERLRPEGAKDWNEYLQRFGRDTLADLLAAEVLTID
jgi:Toprim-like